MKKYLITNVVGAVRGLFDAALAYHEIEPGQSKPDIPLDEGAYKNAASTGYFKITEGGAPAAADEAPKTDDPDALPTRKAELEALAVQEGIDLSTIEGTGANGNVVKEDIAAAIKAKREAGDNGSGDNGSGDNGSGDNGASDDLDAMSDEDLRATVTVLSGTEPAQDATREELLALARA